MLSFYTVSIIFHHNFLNRSNTRDKWCCHNKLHFKGWPSAQRGYAWVQALLEDALSDMN